MTVAFDTGSSDLWVNPDCSTSFMLELCLSYLQYQPKQSTTSEDLKFQNRLQYSQGYMVGELFSDNIGFEGR
jgi:hypothetical protein